MKTFLAWLRLRALQARLDAATQAIEDIEMARTDAAVVEADLRRRTAAARRAYVAITTGRHTAEESA